MRHAKEGTPRNNEAATRLHGGLVRFQGVSPARLRSSGTTSRPDGPARLSSRRAYPSLLFTEFPFEQVREGTKPSAGALVGFVVGIEFGTLFRLLSSDF